MASFTSFAVRMEVIGPIPQLGRCWLPAIRWAGRTDARMVTMTDFTFTPTGAATAAKVPYYEDARADYAPYYNSQKTINVAKKEVAEELAKLGGVILSFRDGYYGSKPRRYGYEITFLLHEQRGVLRVAGLPMYRETETKKRHVLVQALLNVRDWMKTAVTQPVFQPMAGHPLMMHLLVDERRTVGEVLIQQSRIPSLAAGDVVDGEFIVT